MSTYIPFIITVILFMIVPGPSVSVIVANTLRYNLSAELKLLLEQSVEQHQCLLCMHLGLIY